MEYSALAVQRTLCAEHRIQDIGQQNGRAEWNLCFGFCNDTLASGEKTKH